MKGKCIIMFSQLHLLLETESNVGCGKFSLMTNFSTMNSIFYEVPKRFLINCAYFVLRGKFELIFSGGQV